MLKIISGKLKNRNIPIIPNPGFKPTTGKTREAIFNIINSWQFGPKLQDANVLDVFCGSGSLGLEALSRGAKFVSFVDINVAQLNLLKQFIAQIGEEKNVGFIHANAKNLPYPNLCYDIVLMDPPYFKDLAFGALQSLQKSNWLTKPAIIIVETGATEDIKVPRGYEQIDIRTYSNNKILFLKYGQD